MFRYQRKCKGLSLLYLLQAQALYALNDTGDRHILFPHGHLVFIIVHNYLWCKQKPFITAARFSDYTCMVSYVGHG